MDVQGGLAGCLLSVLALSACGDNYLLPKSVCAGQLDGTPCTSEAFTGICTAGVCGPVMDAGPGGDAGADAGSGSGSNMAVCGDGEVQPPESCDGSVPVGCSIFGDTLGETACTACAIDASGCKSPGWRVMPSSAGARALWASSPTDVWALGNELSHFDGSSWTTQPWAPQAVWGFARDDVYFASGSTMLHFDGSTFTTLPGPGPAFAEVMRLWGTGDGDLYAALGMDGLRHWDGTGWSDVSTGASIVDDVWGVGGQLWVVGDGAVLHFDGTAWAPQAIAPGFVAQRLTGCGSSAFVIGVDSNASRNVLARSDGTQWTLLPTTSHVLGVPDLACTPAGEVLAVGWDSPSPSPGSLGAIWYDGAMTFDVQLESKPSGNGVTHSPVWGSLHDHAWVGANASVDDARASWATGGGYWGPMWRGPHDMWSISGDTVTRDGQIAYSAAAPLRAISGSGELVIAVGDGGTVATYDGATWTAQTVPTSANLHAVWVRSTTDAYVAGDYVMLHYDGATWTQTHLDTIGRALWGSGSADLYLAGAGGVVERFDGSSWTILRPFDPMAPELTGIWASSPDDIFVVGGADTVLHWNGVAWTSLVSVSIGDATSVHGTAPDDVFVATSTGTVYRWDGHLLAAVGSQPTQPWDDNVQVWATPGAVYFSGGSWSGRVLVR